MFKKILTWIRSVVKRLVPQKTVESALHTNIEISSKMADAIELWCDVYAGNEPWVNSDTVKGIGLLPAISSEVARLVTLEFESTITGSKRAEYLQTQYDPVKKKIRQYTEYAIGKGGLVLKPYPSKTGIAVDLVQANGFYPTAYDSSGRITGAIFVDQKVLHGYTYTRLESHQLSEKGVLVTNHAFRSNTGKDLGVEVPLAYIKEWAELQPEALLVGTDRPLFSYFKMPFGNTVDPSSPLGVSIAARSMGLLEEADKQYSRILWEFEGGELAIDADSTYLESLNNKDRRYAMPKTTKRLFRSLNTSTDFYSVFNPAFRDQSLLNGLNEILRRIEFSCGLSYGILSNPSEKELTATEIVSAKQRLYSTVCEIQSALQDALDDLIYGMDYWANFQPGVPKGPYTVSYKWDDSIVTDINTEKQLFLQEIRDGIRQKWEYRMRFLGEDEPTAKALSGEDKTDDAYMGFGEE